MVSVLSPGYARTKGMILLQNAIEQFGPVFRIGQIKTIAEELGLNETYLRKLISELAASGRIGFMKRGTYAAQRPFIDEDIHPCALTLALIQPMAISHWSAVAHRDILRHLKGAASADLRNSGTLYGDPLSEG